MGFLDWLFPKVNPRLPSPPLPSAVLPAQQPACPYCGVLFDVPPKRKRKCKDCGRFVFVRQGRPLTEQQAEDLDERVEFASWGISDSTRVALRLELANQFGAAPSSRDVRWSMLSRLTTDALAKRDFAGAGNWQCLQARQLYDEGRQHFALHQESHKSTLQGFRAALRKPQSVMADRVRINSANDGSTCQKDAGREYTIEQALRLMPLPHADATGGWCSCWWVHCIDSDIDPLEGLDEDVADAISESRPDLNR